MKLKYKAFIIYVISFNLCSILIYLGKKASIALQLIKKTQILIKYLDFFVVFSKKRALVLLKIMRFNQYTISL